MNESMNQCVECVVNVDGYRHYHTHTHRLGRTGNKYNDNYSL